MGSVAQFSAALAVRPRRGGKPMGRFIGQRLLLMVPTLLLVSVVSFVIIQLPPG